MPNGTPKQLANLKPPWKKGETGNPGGKKKGQRNVKNALERILKYNIKVKNLDNEEESMSVADAISLELVRKALKDKKIVGVAAFKEIADRTLGKAKQFIEQTNIEPNPYANLSEEKFEQKVKEMLSK